MQECFVTCCMVQNIVSASGYTVYNTFLHFLPTKTDLVYSTAAQTHSYIPMNLLCLKIPSAAFQYYMMYSSTWLVYFSFLVGSHAHPQCTILWIFFSLSLQITAFAFLKCKWGIEWQYMNWCRLSGTKVFWSVSEQLHS